MRRITTIAAAAVLLAGCAMPAAERADRAADQDAETENVAPVVRDEPEPTPDVEDEPDLADRDGERAVVTFVVDGDTVRLADGEKVRLVGIDTPEQGECGFEEARDALAALVEDQEVRLGVSDEDRDNYGRLLRYLDVDRQDAGLALIEAGLAVARYDSRDGYGRHPREDQYVEADERSAAGPCEGGGPRGFADVPAEPSEPAAPAGKNCAPGYRPCVPNYPPDLDCADVGPVTVTGPDPHGLDRDGDGRACGGD